MTQDISGTRKPSRLSVPAGFVLVLAGVIFLVSPRLTGWAGHHVHKEDGFIFLKQWIDLGSASWLEPYTGYLHLLPRAMTALAAQFPAEQFPIVIMCETALFRVWLATCLYWVMRTRGLSWQWAAAAASPFVIVPVGEYEVLGNITNVRWFCDAALILLVIGALRGAKAIAVAVTLFFCALSDPIAIALAPWLLWHALRQSTLGARVVPAAALAGAGLHWLALDAGARQNFIASWLGQPVELIGQFVVRGWQVAQFGVVATMSEHKILGWSLAMVLGLAPIILFALARSGRTAALACSAMYLLATSIAFAEPAELTIKNWFAVGQPSRYSVAPSIVLAVAGVLAAREIWARGRLRWVPILMGSVLLVAVMLDGRGDPKNVEGASWATTVSEAKRQCASSQASEVPVEFTPTTASHQWRTQISCRWLRH